MSDLYIIGLGNPGSKYEGTRHNIGWEVLDKVVVSSTKASPNTKAKNLSSSKPSSPFSIIDSIFDKISSSKTTSWESKRDVLTCKVTLYGKVLELIKPQTYMNNSGIASFDYLKYRNFKQKDIQRLVVVYDDLDLPAGRVKLKKSGNSGGHRGVQNIIDVFKNKDFNRIKVGIGHPRDNNSSQSVNSWVLSRPSSEDRELLNQAVDSAVGKIEGLSK